MNADEYERSHMQIDGPVRFRDRQSEKLVLLTVTGVPLLLGSMLVLGLDWPVIAFMGVVTLLGAAVNFTMSSYRVVLTASTLHVQHGFRTHRIPVAAIESALVAPHRLRDAMFGRGLQKLSLDGSVQSYRAEGLRETVRIEWQQGTQARTTIIATDRAEELASALLSARSGATLGVRIEHGDEEREAAAEVEAFLRERPGREAFAKAP